MSVIVPPTTIGASEGRVEPCNNLATGVPGARTEVWTGAAVEAVGAVGVPTGAPEAEEAALGPALAAAGVPAGFENAVNREAPGGRGAGASRKSGDVPNSEPSLLL